MIEMKEHILLFAGTTEGRNIADHIQRAGYRVKLSICTATEYGKACVLQETQEGAECFLPEVEIFAGRMNAKEMENFMRLRAVHLVIDATHPFARVVTENIQTAAGRIGVPYVRLLRESGSKAEQVVLVDSLEEAVKYLTSTKGNILIATGSKELEAYTHIPDCRKRCFARVLSTKAAVEQSVDLGFEGAHLFAMQGPFSKKMNESILEQVEAAYFVTKESGTFGGFQEKWEAAREAKATLVVIARPREDGMSEAEVREFLQRRYGC